MRHALPLLIVTSLLSAPLSAAVPQLEISVQPAFSGTPLRVDVEMSEWEPGRGIRAEVFLDGERLGQRVLEQGSNTLAFPEVELESGQHEVLISAGTLGGTVPFRVRAGWLTVLPPVIAIALALISRDVLVSLFLGVFGGALLLNPWSLTTAFARTVDQFVLGAVADGDHAAILIFTTLLGGMVGLVTRSGGTHGIVERLRPYATSDRRGQVATWLMGVMIFFDDYANTLIVGPTMRPITDKLRVSREKLAYVVDSTAAPVVCLVPISTWVGFEVGLIADAFSRLSLPFDAYGTFLSAIPYHFYPFFALMLGLTLASTGVDFGPMRRAEERSRETGRPLGDDARPLADYGSQTLEPPAEAPKRARNALLPILAVVVMTVWGLYATGSAGLTRNPDMPTGEWLRLVLSNANSFKALMWASLSGVLVALGLSLAQRLLSLREAMEAMVEGFRAMLMALVVLVLAWSIGAVCAELQTAHYLVSITEGVLSPFWLPVLTFLLAAAVAFSTGTSWGSMAILTPLVIPICHNLSLAAGLGTEDPRYFVYMAGSIASVLSGSVWGDHCSPISDTTILSSLATGCDHVAHVRTQLPYALAMGGLAIGLGCIPAALGLQPWILLLAGLFLIVGTVTLVGRRRARAAAAE